MSEGYRGRAIDLSRVVVGSEFTTRELVEALALYRDVHVIVDHEAGLRSLVDLFTPQGFASFVREFGSGFRVWVLPEYINQTWRTDGLVDLNIKAYGTSSSTAYDRMRNERALPFWASPTEASMWAGDGAAEAVEAIQRIPGFPGAFVEKLFGDLPHLVHAFEQFLQEDGIEGKVSISVGDHVRDDYNVVFSDLRVDWDGHGDARDRAHRLMEFLWAASDAYAAAAIDQEAHLVMPYRSATMVGRDAVSLVRRMTYPRAVSDIFREVVLEDIPAVPDYFHGAKKDPRFLDGLKRCREARLKIDPDVPDLDIVTRLQPWALGSRGPTKMLRWGLFLSGGMLLDATVTQGYGTATGLGLSIFDAFLLDRLTSRWRPDLVISNFQQSYVQLLASQLDHR